LLKDYFASDMKTFFNTGEFAETHTIDNIEKVITIDNEKIKEVSKATNQGISLGEILYSIPVVECGSKIPKVGDSQIFDKKLKYISYVNEDMGMYEIILTQNLGE
jgi:hypothetical protein